MEENENRCRLLRSPESASILASSFLPSAIKWETQIANESSEIFSVKSLEANNNDNSYNNNMMILTMKMMMMMINNKAKGFEQLQQKFYLRSCNELL